MRIDSSGRVLIGTTTEGNTSADELTLSGSGDSGITIRSGTSSEGSIMFSDATSGTAEYAGWINYNHNSNFLRFFTAGSERMRITSAGNVGIGTTSPDVGNSAYKVVQVHSSSTNAYFKLSNDTTGSGSGDGVELSLSGSDAFLTNRESANLIFRTAATERMRIASNGNVGIGTISPSTKLHVSGDVKLSTASGTQFPIETRNDFTPNVQRADLFFALNATSNNALRIGSIDSDGGITVQATRGNNSAVKHDLIVNPDGGNVGIGTTSPQVKLDTTGTGVIGRFKSTNNNYVLSLQGNNASQQSFIGTTSSGDMTFATGSGVSERIRLREGGGLTFNGDTAAANALDDYEEGYWTATATDGMALTNDAGSNNYASRRYIKIGRHVTAWFDVRFSSSNSSANFRTRFGGLPYSPQSNYAGAAAVVIGFFTGANDHGEGLVGHIDQTTSLIKFYRDGDEMYSYSNSAGDRIAGFVSYFASS